tara:strand:- start:42441 stop:42914 length:474 start_codon:yes stop_codon:yes gene_type:complete
MKSIKLGNYEIKITEDVLVLLSKFKQIKRKQPESGGILLGQILNKTIYVTRISFPSKKDKSSRFSFWRNKDSAQIIIDYEFLNSNQKTIYIGEWHTHPEELPNPSGTDVKMINDQYEKNKLNEPFLIQYIQGTKGFYLALLEPDGINYVRVNNLEGP